MAVVEEEGAEEEGGEVARTHDLSHHQAGVEEGDDHPNTSLAEGVGGEQYDQHVLKNDAEG